MKKKLLEKLLRKGNNSYTINFLKIKMMNLKKHTIFRKTLNFFANVDITKKYVITENL